MAGAESLSGDVSNFQDDASIDRVIEDDIDLQELAARFEKDITFDPDTELSVDNTDSVHRDSDSASNSSIKDSDNIKDSSENTSKSHPPLKNGTTDSSKKNEQSSKEETAKPEKHLKSETTVSKKKIDAKKSKDLSDSDSVGSKQSTSTGRKNPLKMLKKLTKFDKSSKKPSFSSEFSTVVIDKLPQVFVVKYLGHREVAGVSGLQHVRKPVDEMVHEIRTKLDAKEEIQLPFLYAVVSVKGLDLREHPSNKVKGSVSLGVIPIDFISYGVQDIKYWRVFTCIVVRTLSWQTRSATCHAFMCDSAHAGRRMALALGVAFNLYAKKLKEDGKNHNFRVELRPPDELVDGLAECDA